MIATIPEDSALFEFGNKPFIDQKLWDRLVNRIAKSEGIEILLARRILNEALGFLRLCALEPNRFHSPSPLVDIGWHAFILYTHEYAEFCEKLAGRFIHHTPNDEGEDRSSTRTVSAMRTNGIAVDEMLWVGEPDCGGRPCTNGDCTSGGPPK